MVCFGMSVIVVSAGLVVGLVGALVLIVQVIGFGAASLMLASEVGVRAAAAAADGHVALGG